MRGIRYTVILFFFLLGISFPFQAYPGDKNKERAASGQGDQSIPEEKFKEIFNQYLYDHLGKGQSDVIVSRFKVADNRPVPKGEISFQMFQNNKQGLDGYVKLVAIVSVEGEAKNRVKLFAWVDVFDEVVCTSRNLKKGEILKKDDVYLERKNITHLSSNVLTDSKKAIGLMAKSSMKAETCLKEWMLEKPPVVEKGDKVTILIESGDLRITVPGRVLETGYADELIRVENSMSKKEIYARVLNSATVAVDL